MTFLNLGHSGNDTSLFEESNFEEPAHLSVSHSEETDFENPVHQNVSQFEESNFDEQPHHHGNQFEESNFDESSKFDESNLDRYEPPQHDDRYPSSVNQRQSTKVSEYDDSNAGNRSGFYRNDRVDFNNFQSETSSRANNAAVYERQADAMARLAVAAGVSFYV